MLRTVSQRKKICTNCPLARAADLLGDTCSLLIVRDLLNGPKRFGDLQASLSGISSRTLANKLKTLESKGIVSRQEFHEHPPRVEYTLTTKGKALEPILTVMREYGAMHL